MKNIFTEEIYYDENFLKKFIIKIIKFLILFLFMNIKYIKKEIWIKKSLKFYKYFINDCFKLKKYHRKYNEVDIPYLSICLAAYNMKNYIEKSILSILNQSFQNFEIIIVNDCSNDNTLNIVKKMKLKEKRIKLINHSKNLGVFNSRVDAVLASRGKYIMLMDPDDMLLNPKLLEKLYKYNLKYNLDITEFTVLCYIEKKNELKIISKYYHFHNFSSNFINQPELSNLLYKNTLNNNYSTVRCRVIWNKIIKKEVLLKSLRYIGKDYYKHFFITAEDTIINFMCFQFAENYSNIDIPGYMYNIREISMTHGKSDKKKSILFCYNHLLYFKKLYFYIKDFKKDRNILYYELLDLNKRLFKLYKLSKKYKNEILFFYKQILNDQYTSIKFKEDVKNFTSFIK